MKAVLSSKDVVVREVTSGLDVLAAVTQLTGAGWPGVGVERLVDVLHRLDEVGLAEDHVDVLGHLHGDDLDRWLGGRADFLLA